MDKIKNKNIAKTLIAFTMPLILSGMLQQMFNWVDAFIVGNAEGELALAGVGATTSIYNLFVMVVVGFTSGISVIAAQFFGQGENEKIKSVLSAFTIFVTAIFLISAAMGFIFSKEILTLLDTPKDIFDVANGYLKLLMLGIPFLALYNVFAAILRSVGNSKAPFLAVLICSCVNVVLDIVFVVAFKLGAKGAAAATAISQIIMAVFTVIYTVKKYPNLKFGFKDKIFDKTVFLQGLKFGFPPALQSGVTAIGNIVLQGFMNGFGEQTVAAITTAYRVDSVILLPIINFGSGISTLVAQRIGADDKDSAKRILKTGGVLISVISIFLTLLVLAVGVYLIKMFGLTDDSVTIGKNFFNAIASCYVIFGLSTALRGYLEGLGDMVFSGAIGVASLCVRIALSYAFANRFGNMIIAYAEMVSWAAMLLMYITRCVIKTRKLQK